MKPVIVFDVNETLLDMAALDDTFGELFRAADAREIRKVWFKQVLDLFLTATVVGEYRSFGQLTDDALQKIATQQDVHATADDRERLRTALEP